MHTPGALGRVARFTVRFGLYVLWNARLVTTPAAAGRLPGENAWPGPRLAAAIRHLPGHPDFNPYIRQLLHVSFKVAAGQGRRYTDLLVANREVVGRQVTENLYERHLRPLFLG